MQSQAKTVAEYLAELPADRRKTVAAVRKFIRQNLGQGFKEGMQYGMIGYFVPHKLYPPGYHCNPKQPLPYICLASQKNYLSLYMMPLYTAGGDTSWFSKAWAQTGKKLDMGKSCIRFQKLEDLALEVIANAIQRVSVARWIEIYETTLKKARPAKAGKSQTRQVSRRSKSTQAAPASRPSQRVKR